MATPFRTDNEICDNNDSRIYYIGNRWSLFKCYGYIACEYKICDINDILTIGISDYYICFIHSKIHARKYIKRVKNHGYRVHDFLNIFDR